MRLPLRLAPLLLSFLLVGASFAGDGLVSEIHPLGVADVAAAHELVLSLLSPDGRAVLDEGHNTIIVLDLPETQEKVRRLLRSMQAPLPNIRVESRIVDRETGRTAELGASGQLIASVPPGAASGSVYFKVRNETSSGSLSAEQFIVVSSGGEAAIGVGKQIPYLGWFAAFGEKEGYFTRDIAWKEVGSRLAVRATAVDGGRSVRLHVVPELEYLVGGTRKRKGTRKEVAFAGAATEIVVESGREVRIGGGEENEEFFSRFLVGYDRQRRVRQVDIFIRPTVLPSEGSAPP
jgi:type II secretory pathway component GspD/PulD (secretin)